MEWHRGELIYGTTLVYSLVVPQMQCSMKCTITERAEKAVHSWRAVCLR